MTTALYNYLGFGRSQNDSVDNVPEPKRALPANWYTSSEMYELERRAIFSRKWLMLTHQVRLKEAGAFLRYHIAGFDFVVSRDRAGNIHAFHNVCRHRAYPVVEKDEGTAKIFSCRYHGWSYGLNGKLAKAPGYQDLEGFDKSQNGLFPIHVHVDVNGFVWVNLDAGKEPEIPWEADFDGVDQQDRFKAFDFENYEFDHVWFMEADYNWKIAADNYNECYHCQTTHPDVPGIANLDAYDVTPKAAQILHDAANTPEQAQAGLQVASTFYWPAASMTATPHFMFMQKFMPSSASKTTMYYEVFRNKHSSEEDFQTINQMYKRIMTEDKGLCTLAQKNIGTGVFVNGELHPHLEKGPLYFQKVCRDIVTEWHKREKAAKQEIWPARQAPDASGSKEDEDFCNGLSCSTTNEALAW